MSLNQSTLATIYQAFSDCVAQKGLDPEQLFNQAGLDHSAINDSEARFGAAGLTKLWRLGKLKTNNPCLVVEVVQHIQPAMLHAVGHAWVTSPTLLAALQRCSRAYRMLSTNVETELVQMQGAWELTANLKDSSDNTDAAIVVVLQMSRMSYGSDLSPLGVELTRPAPKDTSPLDAFFGCSIIYGAKENRLLFSSIDVGRKLRGANPVIAAAMDEVINAYLLRFDDADIVGRVREVVANYLVHGEPDAETVAEELSVTSRTLQRRLSEQNSSVKEIVDSTRHQLSLTYLDQRHLSIKEVAYSLGFNDPSNFSRAFRRWEGTSPKVYRNPH